MIDLVLTSCCRDVYTGKTLSANAMGPRQTGPPAPGIAAGAAATKSEVSTLNSNTAAWTWVSIPLVKLHVEVHVAVAPDPCSSNGVMKG